jgi:carnosine N-methyltransferase
LYSLSKADQDVLSGLGYREKLEAIDKAILVNASFLAQIVADPEIFGHDLDENEEVISEESDPATADCDIAGRYRPFDSKVEKKIISH